MKKQKTYADVLAEREARRNNRINAVITAIGLLLMILLLHFGQAKSTQKMPTVITIKLKTGAIHYFQEERKAVVQLDSLPFEKVGTRQFATFDVDTFFVRKPQ